MKEVLEQAGLEEKHVEWKNLQVPVIEAGIYNTLGRRLFDFYQRNEIPEKEQREFESICFILLCFVWRRKEEARKPWWRKLWKP